MTTNIDTEALAKDIARVLELDGERTQGGFTFSPQEGPNGHCFSAQVWSSTGTNLAIVEGADASIATANAALFSYAPTMVRIIREQQQVIAALHRALQTHDQWHLWMEGEHPEGELIPLGDYCDSGLWETTDNALTLAAPLVGKEE